MGPPILQVKPFRLSHHRQTPRISVTYVAIEVIPDEAKTWPCGAVGMVGGNVVSIGLGFSWNILYSWRKDSNLGAETCDSGVVTFELGGIDRSEIFVRGFFFQVSFPHLLMKRLPHVNYVFIHFQRLGQLQWLKEAVSHPLIPPSWFNYVLFPCASLSDEEETGEQWFVFIIFIPNWLFSWWS